jgi:hypothetical protein
VQFKLFRAKSMTGGQFAVYEWLSEAMEFFEKAETIRPRVMMMLS